MITDETARQWLETVYRPDAWEYQLASLARTAIPALIADREERIRQEQEHDATDKLFEDTVMVSLRKAGELLGQGNYDNIDHAVARVVMERNDLEAALRSAEADLGQLRKRVFEMERLLADTPDHAELDAATLEINRLNAELDGLHFYLRQFELITLGQGTLLEQVYAIIKHYANR